MTPKRVSEAFPSKYMKASDLPESGQIPATIEAVKMEEIGRNRETKPVIYFEDHDKAFVANKTNCTTITKLTASDLFDDWIGKTIYLYRTEVEFGGEMVESIRVSLKKAGGNPQQVTSQTAPPEDDDIPF